MSFTVLKIGGSQARHDELAGLCAVLAEAGRKGQLVVVPGGGTFADAVRDSADRFPLSDTAAHWMAILAMDQYGLLLADMIPGASAVRTPTEALSVAERGLVPVLLPHGWLHREDPLPHSWDVTSDSIAAWIAGRIGAARLILVKDVDGLYPSPPDARGSAPAERIDLDDLRENGGVDRYLAEVLKGVECETWIVNGRFPERVAQLIESGAAPGTRVNRD